MLITHSTFEWANRCTDNLVDVCYFRNAGKLQQMRGGSEGFMSSRRRFWFEEGPRLWKQQVFFGFSDGRLEPGLTVRERDKRVTHGDWVLLFTPRCGSFWHIIRLCAEFIIANWVHIINHRFLLSWCNEHSCLTFPHHEYLPLLRFLLSIISYSFMQSYSSFNSCPHNGGLSWLTLLG